MCTLLATVVAPSEAGAEAEKGASEDTGGEAAGDGSADVRPPATGPLEPEPVSRATARMPPTTATTAAAAASGASGLARRRRVGSLANRGAGAGRASLTDWRA